MTSCDTNILLPACDADHRRHAAARAFLEEHSRSQSFVLCEQVLMELYCLLRNPAVSRPPMGATEAASLIQRFRTNPYWRLVDVPGEQRVMDRAWSIAARRGFAFRRIFDVRLALTLLHQGVTDFATSNARDFEGFGFSRVWDPLA